MGLQKFRPPALPVPPDEYDKQYLVQLIRSLSIYFNQLASQTPTIANTANWSAIPTDANLSFPNLPFNDMYRGDTEDILRIKIDGIAYQPNATQAYVDQAEADAIAASNAFTTAGLALKVNKAGDTMTGLLTVPTLDATNVNATNVNATNVNASTVTAPTVGSITAPGMVLQVAHHTWTLETSNSSTTIFATALNSLVSFTPLYATSNLLVQANISLSATQGGATTGAAVRLIRDSVSLFTPGTFQIFASIANATAPNTGVDIVQVVPVSSLVSANAASSTVFGVQLISHTGTARINRAGVFQSTLTITEIAN